MMRLRHTDEFVGLLVLLTVAALIFAILQVGVLGRWFQPTSTLRILLPASGVGGLVNGADVEVLGTHVGTVRSIIIEPTRRIYAVADIDDQAGAIIPRDSTAVIRRRFGIAGAAYLDIQRGSGAAMDWSYAVIEATTERATTESVSALIDEAREKIFPILTDTGRAAHSLAVMMERLERGEGNVGRVLSDETLIRGTEATVSAPLDAIKTMDRLLAHLDETGGEVAALIRATRDGKTGVPALLRQVDQILVTVNTATRDL